MPRKLYAFVLSALFVFSTSSFAEVGTTSSIRGVVNVSGAEVTVKHVPTGTTKTRTANEDGLFFVSDLLVGGPYEITASASGYQTQSESGLFLVLNKTAAVEISLVSNDMEEIGVTASASSGTIRMGGGISLGEDAIAGVPTINRSIADYAKFDPRVSINTENSKNSSITVMGAHERFNDFSVDGVSFNDPFGLNDNGFGSMRNPISMEFVDQISVDITPYDVSRGNTTGGSIATVTKSGTNEFHGSVFFIERDEGDVGELFGQDFAEFSEETKGFTFSGPIIEDKLFFFVGMKILNQAFLLCMVLLIATCQIKLGKQQKQILQESLRLPKIDMVLIRVCLLGLQHLKLVRKLYLSLTQILMKHTERYFSIRKMKIAFRLVAIIDSVVTGFTMHQRSKEPL